MNAFSIYIDRALGVRRVDYRNQTPALSVHYGVPGDPFALHLHVCEVRSGGGAIAAARRDPRYRYSDRSRFTAHSSDSRRTRPAAGTAPRPARFGVYLRIWFKIQFAMKLKLAIHVWNWLPGPAHSGGERLFRLSEF